MNDLHTRLASHTTALTALAHRLADQGQPQAAQSVLLHAAQAGLLECEAQRLHAALATAEAQLRGSRAALAQSRATVQHLTAELLEEQDARLAAAQAPPPDNTPAAMATRLGRARTIAQILAPVIARRPA